VHVVTFGRSIEAEEVVMSHTHVLRQEGVKRSDLIITGLVPGIWCPSFSFAATCTPVVPEGDGAARCGRSDSEKAGVSCWMPSGMRGMQAFVVVIRYLSSYEDRPTAPT